MKLQDLIDRLQDLGIDNPEDVEVRLAIQPNYPFQHDIEDVAAVELHDNAEYAHEFEPQDADEDPTLCAECGEPENDDAHVPDGPGTTVVYIAEGGQNYAAPYLPGEASRELNWR